ncbi:MAG: DUF4373 domain-containing protein [Muribaculaceae bacterium]|nr:DUF4373 domain-containing protein [Muribaculaceae bacterium]
MSSTTNKQQPYYPHYANTRNEDNIIRLRMAHGVAGYGVYHMLLERLRMSENFQADLDYEILSWDLDCDKELIRSVIYDFGLFEIVCEGQKFQSIEMIAHMQLMEEKKRERQERARAAAQARWGNCTPDSTATKDIPQPELPIVSDETEGKETERLDKEIQAIKEDDAWLEAMAKESGKSKDEILTFLQDFRAMCMLRGLKGGHKDMIDTFSHFRSWIYKSGRAKDPNAQRHTRGKSMEEDRAEKDRAIDERNQRYAENERTSQRTDDYIRSMGYDPADLGKYRYKVMDHRWREKNPPTHPEWITPRSIDVPF